MPYTAKLSERDFKNQVLNQGVLEALDKALYDYPYSELIAGLSTIEIGYLKHLYFKETIEVAYKAAGRVCLCKKGILTLTAGGGPETRLPRFKEIFEKAVVKQTLW